MEKEIYFKINKKKFKIFVKKVFFLGEAIGLMFSSKNHLALLFDFKKNCRLSIHSLFVFYPFLAIWLDKDNSVLDAKIVKPFKINVLPKKRFVKLIEIPFNLKNKFLLDVLVGELERFKYL